MDAKAGIDDDASDAVAAHSAASEAALESARQLNAAWRRHFESGADEASLDWIAEVAGQQAASESALQRARSATALSGASVTTVVKAGRRRHYENQFLKSIGRPGQARKFCAAFSSPCWFFPQ